MATTDVNVTGVVADVERVATSRNGNPTYRVTLEDGRSWLTEVDGAVGYDAPNHAPHHLRGKSEVVLTVRRNRIIAMREVPRG